MFCNSLDQQILLTLFSEYIQTLVSHTLHFLHCHCGFSHYHFSSGLLHQPGSGFPASASEDSVPYVLKRASRVILESQTLSPFYSQCSGHFPFHTKEKTKVLLAFETEPQLAPVPFYFYLLFSPFLLIWPRRLAPILLFFHHSGHGPASESRYLMCLLTRKLLPQLVLLLLKIHLGIAIPRLFLAWGVSFLLAWKLLRRRQPVTSIPGSPWPLSLKFQAVVCSLLCTPYYSSLLFICYISFYLSHPS